jgi:hypothetical protein
MVKINKQRASMNNSFALSWGREKALAGVERYGRLRRRLHSEEIPSMLLTRFIGIYNRSPTNASPGGGHGDVTRNQFDRTD